MPWHGMLSLCRVYLGLEPKNINVAGRREAAHLPEAPLRPISGQGHLADPQVFEVLVQRLIALGGVDSVN